MKIRDLQGRFFTPGVIADIPTGNLLWVDPVNGNDSLALPGRLTVPFQTLGAAKSAATAGSGQTIIVLPGTYNERNLLKNGVNWHFLAGAKVIYSGTEDGAIFDTSSEGTNGAVSCLITGHGEFQRSGSADSRYVVHSAAAGSSLVIHARSMVSSDTCVRLAHSSGAFKLYVQEKIESTSADGVAMVGSGADNIIHAHEITASGGFGLYVTAGSLILNVYRVSASSDAAVSIQGGSGDIVIRAYELYSGSSYGVYYNAPYDPKLTIIGARIKTGLTTSSGRAVQIDSLSSNAVKLHSCVLLASSSADALYCGAIDTVVVEIHGETVANRDKNEDIALVGGDWIPNQAIS